MTAKLIKPIVVTTCRLMLEHLPHRAQAVPDLIEGKKPKDLGRQIDGPR